ncbi:hypothetical protein CORC01_04593 [Colletotrichum orchidophilum]|uniref:Zn(2)-C6 fungal-type domain-containing protein n=1 Tax=Colletotrichum orchidophilum TaxID=1209926 RepID=A0A1G4BFP4_9PEZI|nr:uncharacterized protein CORC01_04593 [Colletotrichum orchidophilum]OHF00185.1 hypothetical protein CORC01_04593 [Colletotrichum orchidophilum]
MGRSRGGCSNCKRRKRKCDETRPDCRACQRRGIQCEGYSTTLKWTNGIASRGRFAGAAIPDLAANKASANSATSDSYLPKAEDASQRTGSLSASPGADLLTQPGVAQSSHTPGSQSGISSLAQSPGGINDPKQLLFQKFLNAGMHRLYTTKSSDWMKSHFTSMAEKSQAFTIVCGAIQAYLDDGFSVSSMEYVDLALQTFRSELESRHNSFDGSTVSAGLLLCSLCLLQARPWTMYLQLMADLYHLETNLSHLIPSADHDFTTRHCIEVLSIMDMDVMVIGRITPSMSVWRKLRKVQDTWEGGRLGGVETVSGLPRSLLDILADMRESSAKDIEARLWAWPGEIGEHAQCILWDCWRYTAVLDARQSDRFKRQKAPANEDDGPGLDKGDPSPFPSREVVMCRLAASVYALYRAVEMPANHHLLVHNGLMYPLVIGSLEVPILKAHPEWKQVFDDVRSSFLRKDSFRLMNMVNEVLNEAWREGTDTFDIVEAARVRGIEIPVF